MRRTLAILLVLGLVAGFAGSAAGKEFRLAEFSATDGTVSWRPLGNYPGLALTVALPSGEVLQETYPAGSSPSLVLTGPKSPFPDGTYTWELLVVADPSAIEETALKDIVHNDDVIIAYSLAVGNDAVNGESFGFDTFRLKENNLRIHFDDTSSTASFPSNDWRIVINDSSNGSASYFAVEDSTAGRTPFKIEAGAPANSLYVDDGGRLGLGTSTPVRPSSPWGPPRTTSSGWS